MTLAGVRVQVNSGAGLEKANIVFDRSPVVGKVFGNPEIDDRVVRLIRPVFEKMLANRAAGQIPALNDPVHERFGGCGYCKRSNLDTLAPRIFEKRPPSSADVEHAVACADIA